MDEGPNEAPKEALPQTPDDARADKNDMFDAAVAKIAPRVREELGMPERIEAIEDNEATQQLVSENIETAAKALTSVETDVASANSLMPEGSIQLQPDGTLVGSPEDLARFIQLQGVAQRAQEYRIVS